MAVHAPSIRNTRASIFFHKKGKMIHMYIPVVKKEELNGATKGVSEASGEGDEPVADNLEGGEALPLANRYHRLHPEAF